MVVTITVPAWEDKQALGTIRILKDELPTLACATSCTSPMEARRPNAEPWELPAQPVAKALLVQPS
eukprot:CAMPEP_0115853888 /NCGR_PEP_ID=MMETSP0287-20121206/13735_1 /TAXON_ID=412157 /ORGANISM="Chrysochromulina rotalis, Strain UIO044" /LENGTH=65 /DNA_ID=CAMNT_0003307977 /DNA_START=597 /DNA_END=794 /DNA_ORIENTATION=-